MSVEAMTRKLSSDALELYCRREKLGRYRDRFESLTAKRTSETAPLSLGTAHSSSKPSPRGIWHHSAVTLGGCLEAPIAINPAKPLRLLLLPSPK
jgi:hypothetical protein